MIAHRRALNLVEDLRKELSRMELPTPGGNLTVGMIHERGLDAIEADVKSHERMVGDDEAEG